MAGMPVLPVVIWPGQRSNRTAQSRSYPHAYAPSTAEGGGAGRHPRARSTVSTNQDGAQPFRHPGNRCMIQKVQRKVGSGGSVSRYRLRQRSCPPAHHGSGSSVARGRGASRHDGDARGVNDRAAEAADVLEIDPINVGTLSAVCGIGDDHQVLIFLDNSSAGVTERLVAAGVPAQRIRRAHSGRARRRRARRRRPAASEPRRPGLRRALRRAAPRHAP
jgi:hypothetical protein